MRKKLLVIVLALSLVCPVFIDSFADAFTPNGLDEKNVNGFFLNLQLWYDKGIAVYGNYNNVNNNDFKPKAGGYYERGGVRGEYRYHGYDKSGNAYTNNNFPVDFETPPGRDIAQYNWVKEPWNVDALKDGGWIENPPLITAANADLSSRIKEGFAGITGRDSKSIFNNAINYPSLTPANSDELLDFFITHQEPTLRTAGAGQMWHRSNLQDRRLLYWSFEMPAFEYKLNTPVEVTLTILSEQAKDITRDLLNDFVDLKVKVDARLKDESYINNRTKKMEYYTRDDIDHWEIEVFDKRISVYTVGNKSSYETVLQIPREEAESGEVTIRAKASAIFFGEGNFSQGQTSKAASFFKSKEGLSILSVPYDYDGEVLTSQDIEGAYLFNINHRNIFLKKNETGPGDVGFKNMSVGGDISGYKVTINNRIGGEGISDEWYFTKNMDDGDVSSKIQQTILKAFPNNSSIEPKLTSWSVTMTVMFQGKSPVEITKHITWIQDNIPPVIIVPKLSAPEYGFDIVPVNIQDNTNQTGVKGVNYYVDGKLVSKNKILGGYIFGENAVGVHIVEVVYESITGNISSDSVLIQILSTKPVASLKISGTQKENRKITLTENSYEARLQGTNGGTSEQQVRLLYDTYPITSVEWNIKTISGGTFKLDKNTQQEKTGLSNKEGTYEATITVTNSLGRKSDPYTLYFGIQPDVAPAVILHAYYSQVARGEKIPFNYEAVSVDGDIIETQEIKIYYDSLNNGSYNQLLQTITPTKKEDFSTFMPPNNLGMYKVVATVKEAYGQETIASLLDGTKDRITIFESYFEVDNYQPASDVYIDVPIERPNIDVYFLIDKNMDANKRNWILNNRVTMSNMLRDYNINPVIGTWDMFTYTYTSDYYDTRTSSWSRSSSDPNPYSYAVTSNGYSGTIYKYNSNRQWTEEDEGSYQTFYQPKTEYSTRTDTCKNTRYYWCTPNGSGGCTPEASGSDNECPSSKYYSSGGWTGTLYRDYGNTTESGPGPCYTSGCYTSKTWTANYSGSVSRTVQEPYQKWVANWVDYYRWTSYYSGTLYKYVRQAYDNSFFRVNSNKYVVYISDNNIADLADLVSTINNNDVKVILSGASTMKNQIKHDHYVAPRSTIQATVQEIIDIIGEESPPDLSLYTLLGKKFNFQFAQIDDEGDTIIKDEMQLIHDKNYFDNSMGKDPNAVETYSDNSWRSRAESFVFNYVGKFTFLRRVQDKPTNDPNFEDYNYYSNISKVEVYAHRKPIANVKLDWRFNASKGLYDITWEDLSYDLDHQYTRADKGIKDRKMKILKNGTSHYIYGFVPELAPGTYSIEYIVQDIEHEWSDPFTQTFTLATSPPMQFEAKARTKLSRFAMNGVPASEDLEIYDIWTRYPWAHKIEVGIYSGNTLRTTLATYQSSSARKEGEQDYYWNNITYNIPQTLPDGSYTLRARAIGQASISKTIDWQIRVVTPINLQAIDFPSLFISGIDEVYNIKASTTKYANAVTVTMQRGTSYQANLTLTGSQSGWDKNWFQNYTYPKVPDGKYVARFYAATPNGNSQEVLVNYEAINNRPPEIKDILIRPKYIYEGDDVTLTFSIYDPDPKDSVNVYLYHRKSGQTSWNLMNTWSGLVSQKAHNLSYIFTKQNVGSYDIRIVAIDSRDFKADTEDKEKPKYQVNILEIFNSKVSHTDKWEENRKVYNLSKTGNQDTPRLVNHYFPGEKFLLSTNTTLIDENSDVYCLGIDVVIDEEPHLNSLLSTNYMRDEWSGDLYNSEMLYWKDRDLNFSFRASWSNGTVKTERIAISIVDDEYWREHKVK